MLPTLPVQAFAVDLDGTLINNYEDFEHPVSEANLAALRDLRAAGTRVLICTGRSESSTRSILARTGDADLAACDLICQNGAVVVEGGTERLIAAHHLPRDEARQLLAVYRRFGLEPMLFEQKDRGAVCLMEGEPGNPRFALYLSIREREGESRLRRVEHLDDHLDHDPLSLASIDYRDKIEPAFAAMQDLELAESRVAVQGLIKWDQGPPAYFLEAFHKDVSKEDAFAAYCAERGYDPARCAAAGDGRNDIELLRMVGFGIAMGQGSAGLKDAADFVAPPYDEDGLAVAVRECLLG
jgi:Cof subfamily protein (haloacid dehalogenase superfamily)